MQSKNLILLILAALVLGGAAYVSMRPKPKTGAASMIGAKIIPDLPVNKVAKIMVRTPETTIMLAKVDGAWAATSRYNYPANFNKIAETILQLAELKIGQVVNIPAEDKGALNLLAPEDGAPENKNRIGTRLELRDAQDGLLASLLIGKPFMREPKGNTAEGPLSFGSYPDGQYLQTTDGKIVLVAKTLDHLVRTPKNWLADEFINVSSADIMSVSISGPDREPILLQRAAAKDAFMLANLTPEEGTLESDKANRIAGALNYLAFDDVADPSLPLNDTGLDNPVVFEARTFAGQIFTLRIGAPTGKDSFDRYLQAGVAWQAPEDKPESSAGGTEAEKADLERQNKETESKTLNERLHPWIYIIKSYRAESMLLKRADLIKKPEQPTDKEQAENQPGADSAAPENKTNTGAK